MVKYNSKMIKTSLDGRKVQTIRPIKFPKDFFISEACIFKKNDTGKNWYPLCKRFQSNDETQWEETCLASFNPITCPYGNAGDILPDNFNLYPTKKAILNNIKITHISINKIQKIALSNTEKEGVEIWNSFYGETECSWDKNPWVWVIDFELIKITKVIINGVEYIFEYDMISYNDIVRFALGETDENVVYAITYLEGLSGSKGTMIQGNVISIVPGMIFNAEIIKKG